MTLLSRTCTSMTSGRTPYHSSPALASSDRSGIMMRVGMVVVVRIRSHGSNTIRNSESSEVFVYFFCLFDFRKFWISEVFHFRKTVMFRVRPDPKRTEVVRRKGRVRQTAIDCLSPERVPGDEGGTEDENKTAGAEVEPSVPSRTSERDEGEVSNISSEVVATSTRNIYTSVRNVRSMVKG